MIAEMIGVRVNASSNLSYHDRAHDDCELARNETPIKCV